MHRSFYMKLAFMGAKPESPKFPTCYAFSLMFLRNLNNAICNTLCQ